MSSDSRSFAGHVFWLFGLSGAGKSTLSDLLATDLRRRGRAVLSLDGDVLRAGLSQDLGFSEADRTENLRRAGAIARIGSDSALTVIAAFITPLENQRRLVASLIPAGRLSLIFVNASLEVCTSRDVKGLYARAHEGNLRQMTGVSAAFEPPLHLDLELATSHESVGQSFAQLSRFVQGMVGPS